MSGLRIDWRAIVEEAVRRRKAEGLSQRALAALAGVSVPTVNAFEQGEIRLRFERVTAILEALDLFAGSRDGDSLMDFVQSSRSRWSSLVEKLAPTDAGRRPLGHFEFAFGLAGEGLRPLAGKDLSEWLTEPFEEPWHPFALAPDQRASSTAAALERWVNRPAGGASEDPTASDYWRLDSRGRGYIRRGYQEDGPGALAAGTIFDLSLPVVYLAAVLRRAAALALAAGGGDDTEIALRGWFWGLAGRTLLAWADPRLRDVVADEPKAVADQVEIAAKLSLSQVEQDLAGTIVQVLAPVHERFEGFQLSRAIVDRQLGALARRESIGLGPFAISKEHVASLGDEPLRGLLGKLVEAEASARGVSLSSFDLGGNQTAADGGIDASIQWSGGPEPAGWLPRRTIYYQSKAQSVRPAAIAREMRPAGELRAIFGQLAAVGGAYIFFTSDDVGTKGREDRVARMREELAGLEGAERIHLDFYGADRIARWVNQHPGVALWLLEQAGRAIGGWRHYGSWSAPGSADTPYLIDETARAVVDRRESTVREAVAAMRGALGHGRGCVRLVGLSGMGKTRLAEALFDARLVSGSPLLPALAIYADAGQDLASGAALVAEQLVLAGADAILVVDNCTARAHRQLAGIVGREASRVGLLTIDYDVGDDDLPETLIVRLQPSSEGVLRALLEQRAPRLSAAELDHLARFSEGNARVALAIARGAGSEIDLSRLSDGELIDRLFQAERSDDPEVRRVADAAALVYAFHVDPTDVAVEHPVLAEIAAVSPDTFYRHVERLLDWGIAQRRGAQRAVKPDAIANHLAADLLRLSDVDSLLATLAKAPERLFASFARRLGQLDRVPKAQAVAKRLLAAGGWLGDLRAQSPVQRRAFFNVAPAAPEDALLAIERVLASDGALPLTPADNDRREFSELLVHLAYDPALFDRAMEALLNVTLAGPDQTRQASEYLLERFWPALSWSLSEGPQRLAFIDRMLDDDRAAVRTLAVEALDHMLDTWHLSSSFQPAFGSRLRDREWRPVGADYLTWIDGAYARLERIARSSQAEAGRARKVVAEHLREHFDGGLAERALAAIRAVRPAGYWDAGWRHVTETLHFYRGAGDLEALHELERELRPRSLEECFAAFVLGEPWRHWRPNGSERANTRDVGLLARAVGRRLITEGGDPGSYIERTIVAGGHTSAVAFGDGLASAAPDLDGLWAVAYAAYAREPAESRSAGVVIGIARGADKRDPSWADARREQAINDPLLQDFIVHLHAGHDLGSDEVARFLRALDRGAAPERLTALMYGGATSTIPAADLARLLRRMIEHPEGAIPALDVLNMRLHGDRQEQRTTAPELVAVAHKLLCDRRVYADLEHRRDHELAILAEHVFATDQGARAAVAICRTLRATNPGRWGFSGISDLARVLLKRQLRAVLDEILARPTRAGRDDLARALFEGVQVDVDGPSGTPRPELDAQILLGWTAEQPQGRAEQLAALVPYTTMTEDGALAWSHVAQALIELAPEPVPVLAAFEDRFFSGVSRGPFSHRFMRRLPMVVALKSHRDRRIRNWARDAEARLIKSIERWDTIDRDHDSVFE